MNYFKKYKPFLGFLARFFGTYAVLSIVYQGWLSSLDVSRPDPITIWVGEQSAGLLRFFGEVSHVSEAAGKPYLRLWFNDRYIARIIEGCNGVAVMILFVSFVIAFAGKWRTTLVYCTGGVILIHLMNVARISILAYLLFHHPEHEHALHGTIFPLMIYGAVFLLWIIWVMRFSFLAHGKN